MFRCGSALMAVLCRASWRTIVLIKAKLCRLWQADCLQCQRESHRCVRPTTASPNCMHFFAAESSLVSPFAFNGIVARTSTVSLPPVITCSKAGNNLMHNSVTHKTQCQTWANSMCQFVCPAVHRATFQLGRDLVFITYTTQNQNTSHVPQCLCGSVSLCHNLHLYPRNNTLYLQSLNNAYHHRILCHTYNEVGRY
jgi:hypothetical protein